MDCRERTIIILLFCLCCPHFSGAQYQFLLHKTYAERYYSIDSLFFNKFLSTDSSALLSQANLLADIAGKAGDEALELEAQLIKADCYYSGRQKNYRLFEQLMPELKKTVDGKKLVQLQIRTRLVLAGYYFNVKKSYGPAFENLLEAYEKVKDIPAKDFPNKQGIIAKVAGNYYYLGDYDMARKYLYEAINTPTFYRVNYAISPVNTLGLIFRDMGMYDSADYYFKRMIHIADSVHYPLWRGIASGNLGISYYLQKRYDEAIPLLQYDVVQSVKGGEIDNALNSLVKLIQINYLQNNTAITAANIRYARSLVNASGDPYKHLVDLYPVMARLSRDNGNTALAYIYADSAVRVRDSMIVRKDALWVARAELKLEEQKYNNAILLKEAEKKENVLIRNGLIIIISLMAVIGILVINRQKQRQMRLEAEKQDAEQRLQEFTRIAQEKIAMIEQISAELEKQTTLQKTNKENADHIDLLEQLRQSSILTDEQWEEFSAVFDKAHRGYIQRLKHLLPELSPTETRFMVLSKLKLSVKEMAGILGIGTDAVRQQKYRLRKKLMLMEDGDLQRLIDKI